MKLAREGEDEDEVGAKNKSLIKLIEHGQAERHDCISYRHNRWHLLLRIKREINKLTEEKSVEGLR